MNEVKPWVNGPLELLRHAEDHLRGKSDFDKRMALISYDNAIEVSITTYLDLSPLQRGGKRYREESVKIWKRNYHTKLEFLEEYIAKLGQPMQVTRDEIVWYHGLRNELYHAGNGMVPAEYNLHGIRKAALWVLATLFGVDAESLVEAESVSPPRPVREEEEQPPGEMLLLESFMRFEQSLQAASEPLGIEQGSRQPFRVFDAWRQLSGRLSELPADADVAVQQAVEARNSIVHDRPSEFSEEALIDLAAQLDGVSEYLAQVQRDATKLAAQRPTGKRRPVLDQVRGILGPEAAGRLEAFLKKTGALAIRMHVRSRSLSYRLMSPRAGHGATASPQRKWTVFLLTPDETDAWLAFPDSHWRKCMPFEIEPYLRRLRALGCVGVQKPKESELRLHVGEHNSAETFEGLYEIVQELVSEMDTALVARDQIRDQQLPAPFQAPIEQIRHELGDRAADGLGGFLVYVSSLPLKPVSRRDSFSFRTWAWRRMREDGDPKRELITVFSLHAKPGDVRLSFPVSGHWRWIVGLDSGPYVARLKALGFVEGQSDLRHHLRRNDPSEMFEQLSIVVRDIVTAMEGTLAARQDITLRESDDALQAMLAEVRREVGTETAERLGTFLDLALSLDLKPDPQNTMIAFRTPAWRRPDKDGKQARVPTAVFYLGSRARGPCLMFPMKWQWSRVEGLDTDTYVARLKALGCIEAPTGAELRFYLQDHRDAKVFDRLYAIVEEISAVMVASLSTGEAKT